MSTRSSKRDIAKARQERAAAKRVRRQGETTTPSDTDEMVVEPEQRRSEDEVLAALAQLHERFENGSLSFVDFEADKAELMRSLHVD